MLVASRFPIRPFPLLLKHPRHPHAVRGRGRRKSSFDSSGSAVLRPPRPCSGSPHAQSSLAAVALPVFVCRGRNRARDRRHIYASGNGALAIPATGETRSADRRSQGRQKRKRGSDAINIRGKSLSKCRVELTGSKHTLTVEQRISKLARDYRTRSRAPDHLKTANTDKWSVQISTET